VFENSTLYEFYIIGIANDKQSTKEIVQILHVLVPLVGSLSNGTQNSNSIIVFPEKSEDPNAIIQKGLVNLIKTNKLSCSSCAGPTTAQQIILQPILSISSGEASLTRNLKTRIHTFATDGCIINPTTQERTQIYSEACLYPFIIGQEIPKFEGGIKIFIQKDQRYANTNLMNKVRLTQFARYPPNTRISEFTEIYNVKPKTQRRKNKIKTDNSYSKTQK
jgi:hypothetical protein